jgi:hypothetical protein
MVAAAGCLAFPAHPITVVIIIPPEGTAPPSEARRRITTCRAAAPYFRFTGNAKARSVEGIRPNGLGLPVHHRWQSQTSPFDCEDDPSRERGVRKVGDRIAAKGILAADSVLNIQRGRSNGTESRRERTYTLPLATSCGPAIRQGKKALPSGSGEGVQTAWRGEPWSSG